MVVSQKSVLGSMAGVTRRVTLIQNPTYSTSTGSWLVNGLDADKQQWQIDLTVLPPGITKDMIKAGQRWFVERTTTYNRLFKYEGEFTPYCHLRVYAEEQYVYLGEWSPIIFDNIIITQSGTVGGITVNGGTFTVPIPGLYTTLISLQGTYSPTLRISSPTLHGNYPTIPSLSALTETLCLTSGNLSFIIEGSSLYYSSATVFSSTYAVVTYAGSIPTGTVV